MKNKFLLVIVFAVLSSQGRAQAVFMDCPLGGKPANFDDSMKNRYEIPESYSAMDFLQLSKMKFTDKLQPRAISVKGYCILVKDGGPETCNCKSGDHDAWDVHIELTQDEKHLSNKDAIVCEINGRLKAIMKAQGVDWSMAAVRKLILHHHIEISGYWFTDDHHKQNSVADNPAGTDDWRISTLEIHPVTRIRILD